ncbi:unnamed protein product [Rhizoctonia solani]|uniref:Uncharacterized protein n=1 Tax=Rhizoctonia solani TaxID=456999 RepID=A0A8H3BJV9_9AGAM|nr:unnamed protein product [Rhizoctonia solani]
MPFSVGLLVGKVEATLGGILNKPALKEKGLAKQKAATAKNPAHPVDEPVATGVPPHSHNTPEEQLAAEGGPGETILAGGGGRSAI